MTRRLRNTVAILVLLIGIVWSLPMETGRDDDVSTAAAYTALDSAELTITAFRGVLAFSGHARSTRHEQRILSAAREHFPSHVAQAEFRPLGVAPGWWDDASVALIASLAGMESPNAHLTESTLRFRALVIDKPAAMLRLQALRQSLPAITSFDVQLSEIDATATSSSLCKRHFENFSHGPVAFEESGTEMRTSAYPVLDSVVSLADACRAANVTITGHTDSTGNEDWNQQLSLARARTVASHLESRGINPDRLIVIGAGSSIPVADNKTRYGRSINRRIGIEFTASSD